MAKATKKGGGDDRAAERPPVEYPADPAKRRAQVERELSEIESWLSDLQARLPQMTERVRSMRALVSGSAPVETDDEQEGAE